MKLNINQWNTVLTVLKAELEKKDTALELQRTVLKALERNYANYLEAENWQMVDSIKAQLNTQEKIKSNIWKEWSNLNNIIESLENQEF